MDAHPATWPEFDVERSAVRVVLQDAQGCVLLLRVQDLGRTDLAPWWELPGGGIEGDESIQATAARELGEETGIMLDPMAFSQPLWTRDCTYQHRGRRILQHEQILVARVQDRAPELMTGGRTQTEVDDILGHRWWTVDELRSSTERFFPGRIPEMLDDLLVGRQVEEPFELWD